MIGDRIKKLQKEIEKRINRKFTQASFAKELEVSEPYLSMVMQNKRQVTSMFINSICLKYNVNRDWLEHGQGDMFNKNNLSYPENTHFYCDADITSRMVCNSCKKSSPGDKDAYLMLMAILDSDQEGTKSAVKQNLKEFIRLVKITPPEHPPEQTPDPDKQLSLKAKG